MTDILVISEWYNAEDNGENEIKNINSTLMADLGIVILVIHKIVSSVAVYFVSGSIFRAFLQFCDLYIFEGKQLASYIFLHLNR